MNDRTAGAILLVIGVVALFAAIVGGGIKIQQIEVGSVQSKWRQWLLALFGLVIGFIGLMMVLPDGDTANNDAEAGNVEVAGQNSAETNAADINPAGENAIDPAADQNDAAEENAGEVADTNSQ